MSKNLRRQAIVERIKARELLLKALYQWQITEYNPEEILENTFEDNEQESFSYDEDYFKKAWEFIIVEKNLLDALIVNHSGRAISSIDPIERACAWIGFYELKNRPDISPKVAINEAINLSKRFGSADGYKFLNSLLDKYAKTQI